MCDSEYYYFKRDSLYTYEMDCLINTYNQCFLKYELKNKKVVCCCSDFGESIVNKKYNKNKHIESNKHYNNLKYLIEQAQHSYDYDFLKTNKYEDSIYFNFLKTNKDEHIIYFNKILDEYNN